MYKNILQLYLFVFCVYSVGYSQTPVTPPVPYTNTTNLNYIRTWEATAPIPLSNNTIGNVPLPPSYVKQQTQYFDGLGRLIQTVNMQQSPNGSDIVSSVIYDALGRQTYKYIPFVSNTIANANDVSNDGNFKADPFQQQASFYGNSNPNSPLINQGENFYYGQQEFEPSPLSRVTKSFAPGNSWVGSMGTSSEKSIQQQYLTNTANDNVLIWTVGSISNPTLQVSVSTNSNGTQTVTYFWSGLATGASTVLLLYSQLGTPSWVTVNAGGPTSPNSATMTVGTYQYAIKVYYSNGTNSIIQVGSPSTSTSYNTSSSYLSGQLYKDITIDENGMQTVEFKDMDGHVILKRVQVNSSVSDGYTGWLCTYYIYDDLGNLRLVMPPKATQAYLGGASISSFQDELCFRYEYDQRQRMIIKKVPGAGEVWMVYDARNRLIMTQDANLRALSPTSKWLVTTYDLLNRPLQTGLLTDANNQSYHASNAYSSITYPVTTGSNFEQLTQNWYDNYTWMASTTTGLPSNIDNTQSTSGFLTASNTATPYPQAIAATLYTLRGVTTGSKVKQIASASQYYYTVNYYDDRDRVIQTQSTNITGTGGIDISTNQYSFNGKVLVTKTVNNKAGTNPQNYTLLDNMTYDALDRLLTITRAISGTANSPAQIIVSNQYDALGRLQTKALGTSPTSAPSPLETLTYDYNIRGWMLGINRQNYISGASNSNYFGMELAYDKTSSYAGGNNYLASQYNGNITGTVWKSKGDGINRKYDFTYDNVNRITGAMFKQNTSGNAWDNNMIDYSVNSLTYDANGNILTMNQNGYLLGSSGPIDQLSYSYNFNSSTATNKLSQVIDNANNPTSTLGDFHYTGSKTINSPADYTYDVNGNLIVDNNKTINSI